MSARETMNEVIRNHSLVHLATVDASGDPCVRAVDFAAGEAENVLYFVTHKLSRKVAQISLNSRVGFAIDREAPTMEEIAAGKYIKGTATAAIIDDQDEMQKAMTLLLAKFPFLADMPGDPADFAVIRLTLQEVLVTDNTVSFGHTEEIDFP